MAKFILVPLDKKAEIDLDFDEAKDYQLIKLILSDNEFDNLYTEGLFNLINQVGNTNIDEFENDSVCGLENLKAVILALNEFKLISKHKEILFKLSYMFNEAFRRNTSVHFYF